MPLEKSLLESSRLSYEPALPSFLKDLSSVELDESSNPSIDQLPESIRNTFKMTYNQPLLELKKGKREKIKSLSVGVLFSGGQASGGHNVIWGLYEALNEIAKEVKLIGYLGGPSGIIENRFLEIEDHLLKEYRNMGGFDLIGSGRTKLEKPEQLMAAKDSVTENKLDALVIIGGDDSNTNAALLAEFFMQSDCSTKVIGIPKTIDGDMRAEYLEITFGFDTASKVYSEMIGNIARDALSAKKYYHFIKLMGRSASHLALECALKTEPNYTVIGEEIFAKKEKLLDIVKALADLIVMRSAEKKNYGLILVPEGLIEFIPEMQELISELNTLLATLEEGQDPIASLSSNAQKTFSSLPESIQKQLLFDRDPHGNVQVSLIETEKLLSELIAQELKRRNFSESFKPLHHFFGYEGRCSLPSNFDATYCFVLGQIAAVLIANEKTGYMASVGNLSKDVSHWKGFGVPITSLMQIEKRKGEDKPVIKKSLVDLQSPAFLAFDKQREKWAKEDCYRFPGPIQFFGEEEITDEKPMTLTLDKK